jgi:hypothetical protein
MHRLAYASHGRASTALAVTAVVLAAPMSVAAAQARDTTRAGAQQAAPQQAATRTSPPARPSDVRSMEAIVAALYDVISGPAGQKRDWDRFRSLFAPGARLIPARPLPTGGAEAVVLTPDDYVQRAAPRLEKDGFFEREVAAKTEAFGNIAHRFSTYESRHAAGDAQPFARGINSIQLLKDGDRWWVVTIFWDSERAGNPIPKEYLPR